MSRLSLKFLGTFQARLNGQLISRFRSRNVQGLLVHLALNAETPIPRDTLATLFWPDQSTNVSRTNLRQSLYQLRKTITLPGEKETPHLIITRQTVQLSEESDWMLDVVQFKQAVKQEDWAAAAALYQGELLPAFQTDSLEFEQALRIERVQLQHQGLQALANLAEEQIASGQLDDATNSALRQILLEPWREQAHRQLMQILAMQGDRSGALAQYDHCVAILEEELGVEPEAATVALYRQLMSEDLSLFEPLIARQRPDPFAVMLRLDPMPDQELFGIASARQRVYDALIRPTRPWMVAIDGIGGIGKSSLAFDMVKRLVDSDRFADIGWVSAKQEEYVTGRGVQKIEKPVLDVDALIDQLLRQLAEGPYPTDTRAAKRIALTEILKKKACLIVIDNLETALDYQTLLPILRHLSGPTKFLITSRLSLANEGDVFCHSLRELMELDALALLRFEAEQQNIASLMAASDALLKQIYATVGGNPLALKLVIGQSHYLPLDQIRSQLQHASVADADQLYVYIYWQAWQMLDEPSRHLFVSLPVVPNATYKQLMVASGLNEATLQTAITRLRSLSLLEVGGSLETPRYRLHRLTETFLLHELLKWQEREQLPAGLPPENHFFQERVHIMIDYWQTQAVSQEALHAEKDAILKAIHFGLTVPEAWPVVKELIGALTSYMERQGHFEAWQQTLERAIVVAQTQQDAEGEIAATILRGRILQRKAAFDEVIVNYRRVIRLAKQSGNEIELARACSNLGFTLINRSRWWAADILCNQALLIFEKHDHQHGQAHTHNHLGLLRLGMQQWDAAESHFFQAVAIWQEMEDRHGLSYGYKNLGLLYSYSERYPEALNMLEKARTHMQATGERGEIAGIYLNIGNIHYLQQEHSAANELVLQAEALFRRDANLLGLGQVWGTLGNIQHEQANYEKATHYWDASLTAYRQLRHIEGELKVQLDRAKSAIQLGRYQEAEALHQLVGNLLDSHASLRYSHSMLAEYETQRQQLAAQN